MVIATKFGFTHDREKRELTGTDVSPSYMEQALAGSLTRLRRQQIDLYQIHVGDVADDAADALAEALERRAEAGDIAAWGWSTDDTFRVRRMVNFPHFKAVQQQLSVFYDVPEMLAFTEEAGLANLNRSPLGMGFLTGKYTAATRLPPDDVRAAGHSWVRDFKDGRPTEEALGKLAAIREVLTSEGRSLPQGALAWNLARSPIAIPLPGFKTEAQVRDNVGALEKGPLRAEQMDEIGRLLGKA